MRRTRFLVVFLIAAAVALWVHDDGVFTSTGRGSSHKTEEFAASEESRSVAKPVVADDSAPEAYAMPSLGSSASPTMFEHGNRKNPPAPQPKYLHGIAPDPQRMSIMLEQRSRDELWLACETRKEHLMPCPSGQDTVDACPVAWTTHAYAPVELKKKKKHTRPTGKKNRAAPATAPATAPVTAPATVPGTTTVTKNTPA
jgi:hypothetical protein